LVNDRHRNKFFIIFFKRGNTDDGISPLEIVDSLTNIEKRKNEMLERFKRLTQLSPEDLQFISNRIIVEVDRQIFDFKLPMKGKN